MGAVDLEADRDNDPIDDLLAATLTDKARQTYEGVRKKVGYRVFKDRKFVVSKNLVKAMKAFCKASGTRNIIYSV